MDDNVDLQRIDVSKPEYNMEEAKKKLKEDGFVVLSNVFPPDGSSWKECATRVPLLLFTESDLLLGNNHQAAAVHEEQDGLSEIFFGKALLPHTDGYIWGEKYPDLVILLCEQADSSGGGENYLIDGLRVVDRLQPKTTDLLKEAMVDHTERSTDGMAEGAESFNPVLQMKNKTLSWRRMVSAEYVAGTKEITEADYISLWAPMGEDGDHKLEVKKALQELDQAIFAEGTTAKRFRLKKGDVLIVDNYRMLHAREAYSKIGQRHMWRVWGWTKESNGLPPAVSKDKENVPSTVKGAEAVISARN